MIGGVADGLIGGGTVVNYLIIGFKASCLNKILLAFFPLGLLNLVNPAFLAVEPLFTDNLVELSFLEINSVLLVLLLLVKLLTLAKFAVLAKELLFVYTLAKLALVSLTLEVGLIPIKGLIKLVILVTAKPIFVDSPVPLALFDYLAESPFMEFSSLRLSQAIVLKESTGFFPEIQVLALLIPFNNSFALILSISASLFYF